MVKKMNQLFSLVKKRLLTEIIKLSNKKKIRIKDRDILFTDISRSNLLRLIAVEGYRSFEGEVVRLIENYPWHIERFIDAGANIGFYSILASIFFKDSVEIIAVEPFPDNVRYIDRLKRENGFAFKLIDKALDRQDGAEEELYYPVGKNSSRLSSSASLINSFKGTSGIFSDLPYKTIRVKTATLESVIGNDGRDTLVKLDCEGSELGILETSAAVLKRDNVDFIIEIMINDKDKDDIYNLMKRYGYGAYLITNSGFVREDRPLTFPYPGRNDRTIWKNHFFTKKYSEAVKTASIKVYNYYI